MASEKLIIIGAGVAGLSAGCFARKNGYEVRIFEAHTQPGGMCTSWRRKDFVFDYCIHNLVGTAQHTDFRRQVWDELSALDNTEVINAKSFVRILEPGGSFLEWYTDLERLGKHLKGIAPEDGPVIDELIGAARKIGGAELFGMALGGLKRTLKVLPLMSTIKRWSTTKFSEFAERFSNPFLKRAFLHVMYDIPGEEVPMLALLLFMAGMDSGDLGWPKGGSLDFSRRLERRFLELGGEITYRARIDKILVENDRAVGVRLEDGSEHRGDRIVSAADGHSTIFGMLEGRYVNDQINQYYSEAGDSSPFGFVAFLGLNEELPKEMFGESHALTMLFDEPLDLGGGITQDSIHLVGYGPESGLVSEGKSILKIEGQASYSYWKTRRDADRASYNAEKKRVTETIIAKISPWFPGLVERIEVMDVSTPPTAERFTGCRFGWQAGPPKQNAAEIQRRGLSKTLPGLDRFHMVGQWATAALGVSSVAVSGRNFVRDLCKSSGKRFVA